jgi:hypothetical protein
MAKGKKMTMEEKLEALRNRVSEVDVGGGDNRFWKPPDGRSIIRLLEPVGEMEWPFTLVGRHYNLPGKKSAICPDFTTEGEERCPICEVITGLKVGSAADQSLAGSMKLSKRYWMNIIVRDQTDQTGIGITDGPVILQAGPMIFQQVVALFQHPDYGFIYSRVEREGVDLVLDKSGQKLDTKYTLTPRRKETPLHTDEAVIEEIIGAMWDLSWTFASGVPEEDAVQAQQFAVVVPSYDMLVARYEIAPGVDLASINWEAEDDGGGVPAAASPAPRRQGRGPAAPPPAPARTSAAQEAGVEPTAETDEVEKEITRRRRTRRPVEAEGEEAKE